MTAAKKYKTRGGYEKHRASKHNNNQEEFQQLSPSLLAEMVGNALCNVMVNKVFAVNLRNELSRYSYQQLDGESDEFSFVKKIYEGYARNGDREKCYGKYHATQFFTGLSSNAATLLGAKVADCLLTYCKQKQQSYNLLNQNDGCFTK